MSEFTSAINGASRLRYGKRNAALDFPLHVLRTYDDYELPYETFEKRAPLTNKFIQSLNGAERLRFIITDIAILLKQIIICQGLVENEQRRITDRHDGGDVDEYDDGRL
uniref:Uncharacterized protein n=1 Tax=Angiostrongylus cantonensis TaxID=6313 RepID=A0A158P948_ANGCA